MMFRKLLHKFFPKKSIPSFQKFAESGNLVHGKNCKLDEMKISIQDSIDNMTNIEIGNDCFISANITLLNPNAKVKIGNRVFIGPGTTLFCYEGMTIEDDIMISWGCTLIDTNSHSLKWEERKSDVVDWIKGPQYKNWSVVKSEKIIIESKTWIGFNAIIMKGVVVGEGSIIASGSVVSKNIERFSIVGGNPAVFIKKSE